jgi:pilus assembly protein CpaB
MKKNLVPLLGVAFVAAVAATGIFYGLLMQKLRQPQAAGPQQVVVAARALPRGAVLQAADLKRIALPPAALPRQPLSLIEQAAGLTLLEPLTANQPLAQAHVAARGAAGGASLAIPPGFRAVSIHPADSGGVVAMLGSGSRVDIQVIERQPGGRELRLRRLLQDVEVLSTGGPEGGGARPVVTLLVTPADADRLTLADAAMQIRLVLRNPADRESSPLAMGR